MQQVVGHLGMTGRMYVDGGVAALPRHAAVVIALDSGRFVFEDARQFGRFHLDLESLAGMGPEPLDAGWTAGNWPGDWKDPGNRSRSGSSTKAWWLA